jgi:hypothetical protein
VIFGELVGDGLRGFEVPSKPVASIDQLIDNETPNFAAITRVAAGVRLRDFAILVTPAFAFAIVFNCRASSLVHTRRAILVLAICVPSFLKQAF